MKWNYMSIECNRRNKSILCITSVTRFFKINYFSFRYTTNQIQQGQPFCHNNANPFIQMLTNKLGRVCRKFMSYLYI